MANGKKSQKPIEHEITRSITKSECWWLHRDFKPGEKVYVIPITGYFEICIDAAMCSPDGTMPYFQLPKSALTPRHKTIGNK